MKIDCYTRDPGDLQDDASWQVQRLRTTSMNPEHLNKIEMILVCFSNDQNLVEAEQYETMQHSQWDTQKTIQDAG